MKMVDVMNEIGETLESIPGLRVYPHPSDSVQPPAAVVQFPTMNYDQAFQRGLDRWEGGILVLVGRVWDEAARDNIAAYLDGTGTSSIHAALRARDWMTCAFARATSVSWPPGVTIGGVDYVAAQIALDIAGTGT